MRLGCPSVPITSFRNREEAGWPRMGQNTASLPRQENEPLLPPHELSGKGFLLYLLQSWQRLSRPKTRQPQTNPFRRFGAIRGLNWLPFLSPAQSPLCKELTRALDSGTAGSNKSEACLGASFIKRPNLPRPFRLIADLQKLLRV